MTLTDLMDHLAEFIRPVLKEYATEHDGQKKPISVYAGYPPQEKEHTSFIYLLVTDVEDLEGEHTSKATVQIGISIYDPEKTSNGRALFNIAEHLRQHLLMNRAVLDQHRLILPLKFSALERAWPQWQGVFTAVYTIGQPCEEVAEEDDKGYIASY